MKQYVTLPNNVDINKEMLQLTKELNEKMTRFMALCSMYDLPNGRLGNEYIEELYQVMDKEVIKQVDEVMDDAMIIAQMSKENILSIR